MTHTNAIDILLENIEQLELPKIHSLKHLDNQEPTIYLCGKSSTGKTTFLNALFNMERDELFTSTNISTKTEFRFQYGEEETVEKSDGTIISLPDNSEERKILFRSINEEGNSYCVKLNRDSLKNKIIVDIPGVLDFKRNNSFFDRMLDEADIVYFFTPCTAKITDSEYNLLKSITEAGLPIIVLFTMGDLTEVDEGITRKTMPKLVQKRLSSCFKDLNISHHQIISSNDYYKNKDSHGIDLLQNHLDVNAQKYKRITERKRLNRTVLHYLQLIENKLDVLNTDSEVFRNLVQRENTIWYKSEKINLEKENDRLIQVLYSEMNWLKDNCDQQIFGNSYHKIYAEQNLNSSVQERNFEVGWDEFWTELAVNYEFLQIRGTKLPSIPETLFDQVTIDLDKLKEILDINTNSGNNKQSYKKKEGNSTDKDINKQSVGNKICWNKLTLIDLIDLGAQVGVNMNNAKLIWDKWVYLNKVKIIIDEVMVDIMEQVENEIRSTTSKLEQERDRKIDAAISKDPTTAPKLEYKESLNLLKAI